jgi:hypothetical protein
MAFSSTARVVLAPTTAGEVILQLTSLDDLTGIAYFIEVKAGASLTFDGETIIPKSGTIYRLRPRT